ncbi:MAG: hypothetical protein PHQ22_04470 [Sulfuricurvum sp.]|nr:hypothetical protein [Sulfuricurvum sp.]
MKIRTGFVTNSSSTSFIIMSKGDVLEDDFLDLLGVQKESDFYPIMSELYEQITYRMEDVEVAFKSEYYRESYSSMEKFLTEEFSQEVYQKYLISKSEGRKIYVGRLSSDGEGALTCFVCCDHLIEENEKIYFNYANCYW